MNSNRMFLAIIYIVMVAISAPLMTQATITCGQVASDVAPCLVYLRGSGGPVPPACCNGIRSLNNQANTTPDRQQACKCLKAIATNVPGLNVPLAGGVPAKCGVNVPFKISLSTDCSKVN